MMIQTNRRKGVESHQKQQLREIVKIGGQDVMTRFRERYKELRIETNRGKVTDAFYIGHESRSRQRFYIQAHFLCLVENGSET